MCSGVRHPDQNRVRHLPRARRRAVSPHVTDDDCTIAKLELRSMVFTDPDSLVESERVGQPIHCRANFWVDQNWNYRSVGY